MLMPRLLVRLSLIVPLLLPVALCGWGTNNRADPFPIYTALDPQAFNNLRHKQLLQGWPLDKAAPERVTLSLSGYGQSADSTRAPCGGVIGGSTTGIGVCNDLPLGDIDGHWNMLALLFGLQPQGQSFGPLLTQAFQVLFPGYQPGQINDNFAQDIDTCSPDLGFHQFGTFANFSNFLKYRKYGVRWDFEAQLIGDFGFQFQGGIADLSQTLTMRVDLTNTCSAGTFDCTVGIPCNSTAPITGALVKQYLMDRVDDIARELCLNICSYHAISIEDLYFCLYWRHAHEVNFKRDPTWARFLVTPFIRLAGSVPSGKSKDPDQMFSLAFTNNGHSSIDINAGINLDFTDTVEIGGEVGYSHFFARDICDYHLPNSTFQSALYPFKTAVNLQPGDTWYGAAKLNAYHFIDRLSFWGQWVIVKHKGDSIRLLECDPAFITAKCPTSDWTAQFINAAFTYDCSPNITLGFVWQFPIRWVRAYKSNTVLFSFIASF